MILVHELDDQILSSFQAVDEEKIDLLLGEALTKLNKKIIVLDDDPTGIQTVHNISVYTDWGKHTILQGFKESSSMFFILTNSRGLTSKASRLLHEEIARNIQAVSTATGIDYILVSRGDSILRGHYPLETETLKNTIESHSTLEFDGEIICPFFKEGGRYTIDNIHYVHEKSLLVPAGKTEFAKDKTFGYHASHLGEWIEEKTKGRFMAQQVVYISLKDLRGTNIDKIADELMTVKNFEKVVVNAIDYVDVKVFALALIKVMEAGKRFIIRGAASITKVLGNIAYRPLLTRTELVENSDHGGLIVIGSYTQKTTAQFEELSKLKDIHLIEFNSNLVWDEKKLEFEIKRVITSCEENIKKRTTVVVYTSRKPLELRDDDKENALRASIKISDAVTAIVSGISVKPAFMIAKGGITSSEVGTKALGVKKALVMGQIKPGIPVWKTDEGSRFSTMAYIIFPGNVGDVTTLREITEELMEDNQSC